MPVSSHPVRRRPFKCPSSRRAVALAAIVLSIAGVGARAGTFVAEPFDGSPAVTAVNGTASITADGTIDSYQGKPGPCATLEAMFAGKANESASLMLRATVAAPNAERDLAKLHLAADVNVEHQMPVMVRVASLDASGKATGTLVGEWLPPCAGSYFRHGIDLSALKKSGGAFDPTAKSFDVSFALSPLNGQASRETMHVDNVSLSAPSFYVGGKGSDSADGKTERTAFATIQKAVDVSGPGDVILVGDGTYKNKSSAGVVTFQSKKGAPARWITLRGAPGQSPKLVNDGWEVVKIMWGCAYLEVRGLDMGGNGDNVKLADALADGAIKEKDGKKYGGDPKFNGNGISAEGRQAPRSEDRPHHLRFIGNVVHDNCGGGISAIACDYVTSQGNTVRSNVHYMRYGGSGMSFLNLSNFDASTTYHAFMLDNVLHDNGCYVPWAAVGHMSDGNSIIIDVNRHETSLDGAYVGRTLVANNLLVGGGGGGVTITTSRHVDIVNNTLYHNVQTKELAEKGWGDVFIGGPPPNCQDVRVYNNVVWSAPGRAITSVGRADDYTFRNNVYFGDPGAKIKKGDVGDSDNVVADPKLRRPSMTGSPADFAPLPGSPAIGHGLRDAPSVPLTGRRRPTTGPVTAGALLPAE